MSCKFPEHHRSCGGRGPLVVIAVLLTAVALGTSGTAARLAADLRDVLVWMAGTLVVVLVVAVALMVREWRRARRDAAWLDDNSPSTSRPPVAIVYPGRWSELPADELAARRASRRAA